MQASGSGGNDSKGEAARWLAAAEKVLASGDLRSAKSFAIRAREFDPRLELCDRIVSVADTILAGYTTVNDGRSLDWYGILQLEPMTQNLEIIAMQYRKLALLLDPHSYRLPLVDQAFKLVCDAWSVLSNPTKKSLYDNQFRVGGHGELGQNQNQNQNQQTPKPVKASPRHKEGTVVPEPSLSMATNNTPPSHETPLIPPPPTTQSDESGEGNFWTACPYCYILYEYPKVYEECSLRCQNCNRAFQAVVIPGPPVTGSDTHFCCWAYFPLGLSANSKSRNEAPSWSPFSPIFACPTSQGGNANAGRPKRSAPKFSYDDQDVYVEVSDVSDDESYNEDDDEWEDERLKKKTKNTPTKNAATGSNRISRRRVQNERENKGENSNVALAVPGRGESSRTKQTRKGAKELGKLDLNVEFSNEVEETSHVARDGHMSSGNGEEDNIGSGFFEGLDEFLSSLPILNVVTEKQG